MSRNLGNCPQCRASCVVLFVSRCVLGLRVCRMCGSCRACGTVVRAVTPVSACGVIGWSHRGGYSSLIACWERYLSAVRLTCHTAAECRCRMLCSAWLSACCVTGPLHRGGVQSVGSLPGTLSVCCVTGRSHRRQCTGGDQPTWLGYRLAV